MRKQKGDVKAVEQGAIVTIVIDNPPLNILTLRVRHLLYETFLKYSKRKDIRVLILRGAKDKAFSVGSDINEFPLEKGVTGGVEKATFEHKLHDLVEMLPQITIAAFYGYVLGGGLELALPCDLRFAAENAIIGTPEINLGGFPCSGGTQRLFELVGPAYSKELMFFGEPVTAKEALRLGLVNRVYPTEKFFKIVKQVAIELSCKPFSAITAIKKCVPTNLGKSRKLAFGREIKEFGMLFETEDMREGLCAFKEKRIPKFVHH